MLCLSRFLKSPAFLAFALCGLLFAMPASAQILIGYEDAADEPALSAPDPKADENEGSVPYSAKDRAMAKMRNTGKNIKHSAKNNPVDLTADRLEHDDANQTIIASGNVELIQGGQSLVADRVTYDLKADRVVAEGNVVLIDEEQNIYYADSLLLENEMSEGFVSQLYADLADGGRFKAVEGRRQGKTIIMKDAAYTPCNCDDDRTPGWQIKADEVTYDEEAHKVSYKNAQFEILGIPVLWSPYLAHPDGQIEQKSGFLPPSGGYDSQLGAVVTSRYYWALAPDRDLTTGVMLTTNKEPVALAEYRQRFANASIEVEGSTTYSSRPDRVAGEEVRRGDEWRSHVFADGRWDINDQWRAGLALEYASDDQYLRQYDFSDKNVLENEIYAERFSGRNYAVGRLLSFQDVRLRENREDQPNILPEINLSYKGDPNATLGGRWGADLSFLQLERGDDGQDMTRVVGEAEWYRRHTTGFGLVNTVEASARGDLYYARDRNLATAGSGRSNDDYETRFYPRVHAVSSYPLVRDFDKAQAIIEPIASLTVSADVDSDNGTIPNEDSQDVQIDTSNLFQANRFPGKDKIEDKTHATYGVRTGLYAYDGSYLNVMLGQSYRFDDENPFPTGSGLSQKNSDIVGEVKGEYKEHYGMNYRFQYDSDRLSSQRHELDALLRWDDLSFGTRYLFAKALEGTDIEESREQIENAAAYYLTDNWRLRLSALHDLGEDPGLRKATLGLDYFGCCISFSIDAKRTLTQEAAADSNTEVMFRLGLKGLGEFQSGRSSSTSIRSDD